MMPKNCWSGSPPECCCQRPKAKRGDGKHVWNTEAMSEAAHFRHGANNICRRETCLALTHEGNVAQLSRRPGGSSAEKFHCDSRRRGSAPTGAAVSMVQRKCINQSNDAAHFSGQPLETRRNNTPQTPQDEPVELLPDMEKRRRETRSIIGLLHTP